ncbi:c-type cytochrome [Pseudemcibacter aquimaris]|uniref:c-type cytochrome n=1 Tax=Pseudemcibacter aquimaris TaxID=2857064 RepID=UPI0020110487|nr:cytochrome c [Pseudemcibacter aquimaris]MCC3860745.1 cytochrome c [Pseudemcibacter aquimaris]WDU59564.1 cytochrome c [Pseudemcibacter aquimaris]
MTRNIVILLIIALIGGVYFWLSNNDEQNAKVSDGTKSNSALVSVTLPEQLSDNAIVGKRIFEAKCASCHGQNAAGQKGVAPPLIHKIYEPSHHGDESFQRAAALGVRAHHWPFGNMPPVDGLTRAEVSTIITYVRELQRANGIN